MLVSNTSYTFELLMNAHHLIEECPEDPSLINSEEGALPYQKLRHSFAIEASCDWYCCAGLLGAEEVGKIEEEGATVVS